MNDPFFSYKYIRWVVPGLRQFAESIENTIIKVCKLCSQFVYSLDNFWKIYFGGF